MGREYDGCSEEEEDERREMEKGWKIASVGGLPACGRRKQKAC